ncbi:hypothetical protein [Streptomyces antibioticus]|uniref:hypothetical protein n=1 Tax=Streptomyces antibioticus TaxID=1890 RepID=UPI0033BE94DF
MVDRPPHPTPNPPAAAETFQEIADRLGRPLTTVSKTWSRHPAWPTPLPDKRGRRVQFDRTAVDQFVHDHIDRPTTDLEPTRLYTAQDLEAAGIGITAATIWADRSRGRWPAPDDTAHGVNRWLGATAAKALAGRRGYRRTDT